MSTDLQGIAEGLEEALADGFESFRAFTSTLLAPEVRFVHDPPQPNDGRVEKAALAAHEARIDAAFAQAIPDVAHHDVRVWATDEAVHTHYVLSGHLRDGTDFAVSLGHVFRFHDGLVDEYVVQVTAGDAERLKQLLAPG